MEEEQELTMDEKIYLDISSQKKPSYVDSNNLIIFQDSETKKELYL